MSDPNEIWQWMQQEALTLGIAVAGVSDTNLQACEPKLRSWLDNGMHGEMAYMARHGISRLDPDTLLPGTVRIVSVRVNYLWLEKQNEDEPSRFFANALESIHKGAPFVSLYARGRDYHKVIRKALQTLASRVHQKYGDFGYRVAVDSAPCPEVEIARKAGLGWRGKHTLLIHPKAGSFFFLGELFTNLPLPVSGEFETSHCGQCRSCMDICPTQAIVEEGLVDARRCISYLTIEHQSAIPVEFRKAIGTRLYGCDDCQLICPWNKFAESAVFADFAPRHSLDKPDLMGLLDWKQADFERLTEGMAIRRIGFERFQRNLMVVCGNSPTNAEMLAKLASIAEHSDSEMVREHARWALNQHAG